MSTSPALVCLGEPLIEFNRPREGDGRTWLQGFGGDSQNVAIAAARQGASAGYLTSLGQDWMGDAFLELWQSEGVDASRVSRHPSAPTGVSFVTHGHGRPQVRLPAQEFRGVADDAGRACRPDYIAGARFFHLSAIGQAISDSARQTCDAAIVGRPRRRREGFLRHQPAPAPVGPRHGASARSTPPSRAATSRCRASTIRSSSPGCPSRTPSPTTISKLGAPLVALKMAAEGCLIATPGKRFRLPGASRRFGRCDRRRRHLRRRVPGAPAGRRRSSRRPPATPMSPPPCRRGATAP